MHLMIIKILRMSKTCKKRETGRVRSGGPRATSGPSRQARPRTAKQVKSPFGLFLHEKRDILKDTPFHATKKRETGLELV